MTNEFSFNIKKCNDTKEAKKWIKEKCIVLNDDEFVKHKIFTIKKLFRNNTFYYSTFG